MLQSELDETFYMKIEIRKYLNIGYRLILNDKLILITFDDIPQIFEYIKNRSLK